MKHINSSYDPHSPDRQKAAKYAKAGKVCSGVAIAFGIASFVGAALMKVGVTSSAFMLLIIPMVILVLLGVYFKNKDLKLRCTERTTALCIDTVRRRSGRHSARHPVVEYEVDGVRHTAELSVSCSKGDVGELYTIYYDPLDPDTVRDR